MCRNLFKSMRKTIDNIRICRRLVKQYYNKEKIAHIIPRQRIMKLVLSLNKDEYLHIIGGLHRLEIKKPEWIESSTPDEGIEIVLSVLVNDHHVFDYRRDASGIPFLQI
jgi:hypothetical protein